MQSSNLYAIIATLAVYAGVATFLLIAIFIVKYVNPEHYVPVKDSISFNSGLVKINFHNLTKITLKYDEWYIRLTDKDKNECDIHFYKNRRCRRIMKKMGSIILDCYKAYSEKDKIPLVSDKLYKRRVYNNKAFVIVNKTKVCITESTEIK